MDSKTSEFTELDLGHNTPRKRESLQFSLRHRMILMAVLSVAFAVLFEFPNWLASALLSRHCSTVVRGWLHIVIGAIFVSLGIGFVGYWLVNRF